ALSTLFIEISSQFKVCSIYSREKQYPPNGLIWVFTRGLRKTQKLLFGFLFLPNLSNPDND
ncbi:MAG: hypothetical protein MKZ73_03730, partial [Alphaproteobacteria bacterium]|nr:hypothetical protein [Alphaproteobacteria bacterium]